MTHSLPLQLLVVDDNRSAAEAVAALLEREGHEVEVAFDGLGAIARLDMRRNQGKPFDLVFTDLRMEPIDGMAVVRAARAGPTPAEVVVFTAYGSVDVAVEAMRLGAMDFLTKPVTADQLLARVRALRQPEADAGQIVGGSAPTRSLREQAAKLAQVRSTVLITGETGTGRSHFARWLHHQGLDRDRPLLNLRPMETLPPEALARAGTLLVAGVDDWSEDAQGCLLAQLGELEAGRPPRVIATASPEIEVRAAAGTIAPELYFRLAVLVVRISPLRLRVHDIDPLLHHFAELHAAAFHKEVPLPSAAQLARLETHAWPGNVREVANLAERAVVLGASAFDMSVRPQSGNPPEVVPHLAEGFQLSDHLEGIERALLVKAVEQTRGDRGEMCKLLGLERNTLRYKLNKYGLLDKSGH